MQDFGGSSSIARPMSHASMDIIVDGVEPRSKCSNVACLSSRSLRPAWALEFGSGFDSHDSGAGSSYQCRAAGSESFCSNCDLDVRFSALVSCRLHVVRFGGDEDTVPRAAQA